MYYGFSVTLNVGGLRSGLLLHCRMILNL